MNSELIIYKKCEVQVKRYCLLNSNQGLEGYFRDPGFDQNGSRDLGKRTISWREKGFDCYSGSGIHQNLGAGCGILAVCREFGKWYVLAVNAKQLASVQWCVLSKQTINAFKKSTERTEDPLFQPDAKRVHLVLAYHYLFKLFTFIVNLMTKLFD